MKISKGNSEAEITFFGNFPGKCGNCGELDRHQRVSSFCVLESASCPHCRMTVHFIGITVPDGLLLVYGQEDEIYENKCRNLFENLRRFVRSLW